MVMEQCTLLFLALFLICIVDVHALFEFLKSKASKVAEAPPHHGLHTLPADVDAMRGVPPHLQQQYSLDLFICDGGHQHDKSVINDGYCDCLDGTDEPGTGACATGVFHCVNQGYRIIKLSSSRVDDQVCDCCDGSDEGYVATCPNTCREAAQKEKMQIDKLLSDFKIGSTIRSDLIQKIRDDKGNLISSSTPLSMELHIVQEELDDMQGQLAALQLKKSEAEERLRSSQRNIVVESLKLESLSADILLLALSHLLKALNIDGGSLTKYAANADTASVASNIPDEDDIVESAPDDDEYLDDHRQIDDDAVPSSDGGNLGPDDSTQTPPLVVEGEEAAACRIVELTNDFALLPLCDSIDSSDSAISFIVDLLLEQKSYGEILLILGYYRSTQSFVGIEDFLKDPANIFPADTCGVLAYPTAAEELSEEYCRLKEAILHLIGANANEHESESILNKEIDRIRGTVEGLERRVVEVQKKQSFAKDAADEMERYKDFLEYLAVKDECFEAVDGAFKYSLCVLNKVTQSEIGGNRNEVTLGSFKTIEEKYQNGVSTVMYFEHGQYCHAFGERKAQVSVLCAARNALISAAEPSTCSYQLVFESPIGCSPKYAQMIGLTV